MAMHRHGTENDHTGCMPTVGGDLYKAIIKVSIYKPYTLPPVHHSGQPLNVNEVDYRRFKGTTDDC
jgi:hypothetical protein